MEKTNKEAFFLKALEAIDKKTNQNKKGNILISLFKKNDNDGGEHPKL